MLPNYIFIGPDKTGSTWLGHILSLHSDVFIPDAKDIYFFDRYYDKGLDWYESVFAKWKGEKIVGDISHDYFFRPETAELIKKDLPDVKTMTILRNPIDKIWSQYLWHIRSGLVSGSFEDAMERHPEIVGECKYFATVKKYKEVFGDQFKIMFFDDLKNSPEAFAKEIFEFLDIAFDPDLPYDERVLGASKPRNTHLALMGKKMANFLREIGQPNLLGKIKRSKMIQKVLYSEYDKKPRMTDSQESFLIETFSEDIAQLEGFLHRDLTHWKKEKSLHL